MVRNDQDAVVLARQLLEPLRHHTDGVAIKARIGLVEDGKLRTQHRELENFHPLLLAAREPLIEITASESRVHIQLSHTVFEFLTELSHRHQVFTLSAVGVADVGDRVPQKVGHLHAGNRDRVLKRQKQPHSGPLGRVKVHDIRPVDLDCAGRHLVLGVPDQSIRERRLARPVGPHQGVNFTLINLKVHPLQNRLVINGDVQVSNFQRAGHESL